MSSVAETCGSRWTPKVLGHLRWQAASDGRADVNGRMIHFPVRGILRVRRLVLDAVGNVKDVGGEVAPIPND
jgi:hypothetical protein